MDQAVMDMDELGDLNPEELVALQGLLELSRVNNGGHFASWGRRQRRSRVAYSTCNYEDEHAPPPPAAVAVAAGEKPAQGSPTTPLRWSGNERLSVSASAPASTSSDSAAGPRPCDRPLGPKLKFKVERKLGVHKSSNGKGPKKKTLGELKELFIGLSSEKEEMEKEKEKLFNRFQSLRDQNMLLKQELALKLGTKGQHQLPTQSPTVSSDLQSLKVSTEADALESSKNLVKNSSSAEAMGWYSSAEGILHSNGISWTGKSLRQDSLAPTMSSSHAFVLPDLNMPAEDVEDLSDNQVVQTNSKAIVAAEARKYRMECLRLKHSQSVKAHIR
ncbi:hypothetical protein SUGI_0891350 [Cryptomeria japonica]|uniref:uncharacterized protein LOC131045290 n=1 Tax=Cryptomeria japonica TaxID=3369 RepID=UPI0024148E91|nr:uncharacterized protein LOC131045290 [Cryptomeria japonica]GLJ42955.1 hypothetical protein SUGI_0891350 [Cryptomeria japonica]